MTNAGEIITGVGAVKDHARQGNDAARLAAEQANAVAARLREVSQGLGPFVGLLLDCESSVRLDVQRPAQKGKGHFDDAASFAAELAQGGASSSASGAIGAYTRAGQISADIATEAIALADGKDGIASLASKINGIRRDIDALVASASMCAPESELVGGLLACSREGDRHAQEWAAVVSDYRPE